MAKLEPQAERELLRLLEEALDQPERSRREWFERKLRERDEVGRKLEDLLALAKRNDISLWKR